MYGGFLWASTVLSLVWFIRAQVSIDTPANAGSCPTVQVSCAGGTGPYQVQLVPGQHDAAAPMRILADSISGSSYQWAVDVGAGTSVALICKDRSGAKAASSAFPIQATKSGSDCSPDQGGQAPGSSSSTSESTSTVTTSGSSSSSATSVPGASTSSGSGQRSTETSSYTSSSGTSSGAVTVETPNPTSDTASTTDSSPPSLDTGGAQNSSSPSNSSHINIVGPIVGGVCALIAVLLILFFYRRRTSQGRAISIISDGRLGSTPSQSSFIEPFVSPSIPPAPNTPWNRGPSKYGFSGAANPRSLPPPSPTVSNSGTSSGGTNVLSAEQASLVQQLFNLQVPAPAVTQVIDRMLSQPGSSASSDTQNQRPPAYDFKQ